MKWLYNSEVVGDADAVSQGAKIFEYPSEIISSGHLQIDFAMIIFIFLTDSSLLIAYSCTIMIQSLYNGSTWVFPWAKKFKTQIQM